MNTLGLVLLVSFLYWFPLTSWFMPFRNEIFGLKPYLPILVAAAAILYIVYRFPVSAGGTTGSGGLLGRIGHGIGRAFFVIVILPILILIALADTALLGPFAQSMWKYQPGVIALIVLSALGLHVLGPTEQFLRKYLMVMTGIGAFVIAFDYFAADMTNRKYLLFPVESGVIYVDPVRSVYVSPGDQIEFTIRGEVYEKQADGSEVVYPPFGNIKEPIMGVIPRSRGEVYLSIFDGSGNIVKVPVNVIQTGVEDIFGFDVGPYAKGYWLKAETKIPEGIRGRINIGFTDLKPERGWLQMRLTFNPHSSIIGRLSGVEWFWSVVVFLIMILLAGAAVAGVKYIFPGAPIAGLGILVGVFLLALVGALFQIGVFEAPSDVNAIVAGIKSGQKDPPAPPGFEVLSDGTIALDPGTTYQLPAGTQPIRFRFAESGVSFLDKKVKVESPTIVTLPNGDKTREFVADPEAHARVYGSTPCFRDVKPFFFTLTPVEGEALIRAKPVGEKCS